MPTGRIDGHIHPPWWRVPVVDQFCGGRFLGILFFDSEWPRVFLTTPLHVNKRLQVLGLVILRVKEPTLERPYKTWIITPLVFCAVRIIPQVSVFTIPPTDRHCHPCAGVFVPAVHAHYRSAFRGHGRAW